MLALLRGMGSSIPSVSTPLAHVQLGRNAARAPATLVGSPGICPRRAGGSVQRMPLSQQPLEVKQISPQRNESLSGLFSLTF